MFSLCQINTNSLSPSCLPPPPPRSQLVRKPCSSSKVVKHGYGMEGVCVCVQGKFLPLFGRPRSGCALKRQCHEIVYSFFVFINRTHLGPRLTFSNSFANSFVLALVRLGNKKCQKCRDCRENIS